MYINIIGDLLSREYRINKCRKSLKFLDIACAISRGSLRS